MLFIMSAHYLLTIGWVTGKFDLITNNVTSNCLPLLKILEHKFARRPPKRNQRIDAQTKL
jgi:hypothetical protein